jgi:hypothetical protein
MSATHSPGKITVEEYYEMARVGLIASAKVVFQQVFGRNDGAGKVLHDTGRGQCSS